MVCLRSAIERTPRGMITNLDKCDLCGKCTEACPTRTMAMSGRSYTVDEIMAAIRRERPFFEQSGGGVTFSGGEPLMQPEFLLELLDACGAEHIHRAVDTSGYGEIETLLEVAQKTDLFLYDLKHVDCAQHKKYTGIPNEKVLSNLKILSAMGANINIRIPLIGGFNSDEKNIRATAEFVLSLEGPVKKVSLLPYHSTAAQKYAKLGRSFNDEGMSEPEPEEILRGVNIFKEAGIDATAGG